MMKELKVGLVLSVLALFGTSGCGAVYQWDTMQLRSAQKQAAQQLLENCKSGDTQACSTIAATPMTH